MEKIILNFSIAKEEINAEEFIAFCKKIIFCLKAYDDIFNSVNVIDVNTCISYFFENDLSDFDAKQLKLIINEQKDIVYDNSGSDNQSLTEQSKSWIGFSSVIFFGGGEDVESTPEVSLTISQGATGSTPATIKIEFADKNQKKLTTAYTFGLIEEISKVVKVLDASAISGKFFVKVRRKAKPSIGWINYTRNKNILTFLKAEEEMRELSDGVIFSIVDRKIFDALDQSVINRSIEISDFLDMKS